MQNGVKNRLHVLHLINTLASGMADLHLLTWCRTLKTQGADGVIAYLKGCQAGSR
jgi:hypothetical protein